MKMHFVRYGLDDLRTWAEAVYDTPGLDHRHHSFALKCVGHFAFYYGDEFNVTANLFTRSNPEDAEDEQVMHDLVRAGLIEIAPIKEDNDGTYWGIVLGEHRMVHEVAA